MQASPLKDVFISYGRRESIGFAARLFAQLKLAGYEAWFDKVNIQPGNSWRMDIADGIRTAHSFVFLIAPHSVQSGPCLEEIEQALKWGKRIIPIMHIRRFETDNPARWDRNTKLIGKFHRIEMKEQITDIKLLEKWAKEQENIWAKLDQADYCKDFQPFSDFQTLDSFDSGFKELCRILEKNKDYAQKHNELLAKAYHWDTHQRQIAFMLAGSEREAANQWLSQEFLPPEQPPCKPSDLHIEYICESRKNAENLQTDCFISHVAADVSLRNRVRHSLGRHLVTTWLHQTDIRKGETYEQAVWSGIEGADNVLFFITKEAIESEKCQKELEYAMSIGKRIIPLLVEDISEDNFPPQIKGLQFVDFTENKDEADYEADIADIVQVINTDVTYHYQHKVFLTQALKWERQHENPSILLHGYNLQNAQAWLSIGRKRDKNAPLEVQERFIHESAAQSGQIRLEVFISYSRNDGDFARKLNEQLKVNGKTTWFDQDSIAEGADFQKEIFLGIENCSNFLFLISPKSVTSPFCAGEVAHAALHNKRFITVLVKDTPVELIPKELADIQWINATQNFQNAFNQLIRTLNTDRDYINAHAKWQAESKEWLDSDKNPDMLLRGSELAVADAWLKNAISEKKTPPPTTLQVEFLTESKQTEMLQQKQANADAIRQKFLLRVSLALLVVSVCTLVGLVGFYLNYKNSKFEQHMSKASEAEDKYDYQSALDEYMVALDFDESNEELKTKIIPRIKTILANENRHRELMGKADSLSRLGELHFLEAKEMYTQAAKLEFSKDPYTRLLYVNKSLDSLNEAYKRAAEEFYSISQNEFACQVLSSALKINPSDPKTLKLLEKCQKSVASR